MPTHIDTVVVRGRKIRALRGGPVDGGGAEPLLYLHGASMENETWLPFLSAQAEGRQVHAPSHPGFLDSEGIDEIASIDDLVEHYIDYIETMGWTSVAVVGLSFGGWIAAELATRRPELVTSLVLIDSAGMWMKDQPIADIFALDPLAQPARARQLTFAQPESPLALSAFPDPGADGKPAAPPDEEILKAMKAMAALAKVGWNPLLHNPALERRLHRIIARTLVIWGAEDRIIPVAYGRRFAELIPGARLELVEAAGHLPPIEQPERFATALNAFLN
jgi:pimeloyl-ACP methyl ester carboxylesterase